MQRFCGGGGVEIGWRFSFFSSFFFFFWWQWNGRYPCCLSYHYYHVCWYDVFYLVSAGMYGYDEWLVSNKSGWTELHECQEWMNTVIVIYIAIVIFNLHFFIVIMHIYYTHQRCISVAFQMRGILSWPLTVCLSIVMFSDHNHDSSNNDNNPDPADTD